MEDNATYYTELITRYLAGEANENQISELSAWLQLSTENRKVFDDLRKVWEDVEITGPIASIDIDEEWEKLRTVIRSQAVPAGEAKIYKLNPEARTRPGFFLKALRIAAVFVALAVCGTVAWYLLKPDAKKMTHLVAVNDKLDHKLPDGSSITLNSGSTLDFPQDFEKDKRAVTLKGEAYFDVTHDENRPFVIAAENVMVEVLGTSFYVNTNAGSGNVEVILTSGKVAVYQKDKPENRIILAPGEKAEVSKATNKIVKSENEDEYYMSLKTNRLVFSDAPLSDVVAALNRFYKSNVRIADTRIADCKVSIIIERKSLESALKVLKATLNIQIKKSGSDYEITGTSCK